MGHIPIEACRDRHIYRLQSRNLRYGVFCKKRKGFIGIRTKFDSRFLFMEYHYDNGPPFGTARPIEDIDTIDSPHVRIVESLPPVCLYCGERTDRKNKGTETDPSFKVFHITGDGSCKMPMPCVQTNTPLFNILDKLEEDESA